MIPLGRMLQDANKEVVYCNQKAKGYILLTLTREAARADMMAVSTILAKPYEAHAIATFEVEPGASRGPIRPPTA